MLNNDALELTQEILHALVPIFRTAGVTNEELGIILSQAIANTDQISEIEKYPKDELLNTANMTVIAYILSRWQSEPSYVDEMGETIPLNLSGDGVSFDSLYEDSMRIAQSMQPTITPTQVIDKLVERNAALLDKDGKVHRLAPTISPSMPGSPEPMYLLNFISGYVQTSLRNLFKKDAPLLQKEAMSIRCPKSQLPILKKEITELGNEFITHAGECINDKVRQSSVEEDREVICVGAYISIGR